MMTDTPSFIYSILDKAFTKFGLTNYTHQHFGILILFNVILQFTSSFILIKQLVNKNEYAIPFLSAVLFTLLNEFLIRNTGHLDLGSHYLLILSIYTLFFVERNRHLYFTVLSFLAIYTHVYLFGMVFSLYFLATIYDTVRNSETYNFQRLFRNLLILLTINVALVAQFYVFTGISGGSSIIAAGYGIYRADLLTFLDGRGSIFLGDLPSDIGEYEGAFYLGIGFILVLITTVVTFALKDWDQKRVDYKIFAIFFLYIFVTYLYAASNKISIGSEVFVIQSRIWEYFGSIFRASGRFVWPVGYLVCFGALWYLNKMLNSKSIKVLLLVACIMQVAETRVLFNVGIASGWSTEFIDTFKSLRESRIKGLRTLEPGFVNTTNDDFLKIAFAAANAELSIDQFYMARPNHKLALNIKRERMNLLKSGELDEDFAYLIPAPLATLSAENDGIYFYPFGEQFLATKKEIAGMEQIMPTPSSALAHRDLSGEYFSFFIEKGWHSPEIWGGSWTSSPEATLVIPRSLTWVSGVTLELTTLGDEAKPAISQDISVECPNQKIATREDENRYLCAISGEGPHEIAIKIDTVYTPEQLKINSDQRMLGVAMRSIVLR